MANLDKTRVTVEEFLAMPEPSGIVELIDGEIFETVTKNAYQMLVRAVFRVLDRMDLEGQVLFAPLRVFFGEHILEPDVLWIASDNENCFLGEDDYWHGAPDLVVEVLSPSTESRDRSRKYEIYEEYGVREYWMVNPDDESIEVYALRDAKFVRVAMIMSAGTKFSSPTLGQDIAYEAIFTK